MFIDNGPFLFHRHSDTLDGLDHCIPGRGLDPGSPSLTQVFFPSKSLQFYGWWGLLRLLLHCQSWKKNNRQLYLVRKRTSRGTVLNLRYLKVLYDCLQPRKTYMEPKNDGVEYELPIQWDDFQVPAVNFPRCIHYFWQHQHWGATWHLNLRVEF